MDYTEVIGYIASAFVLLSFVMKEMTKLRYVNIVGCAFFIFYGVLLSSWPIIITNVAIVCVNVFYLTKKQKNKAQ
ncbi:MAG: YgjV family protein [Crocinitomicaceae bacterium]|nr:YgjV family protein [Flavobacteriales bacterium]NQZ36686.1 YgjV family protein [Crocinitomicaceae bacterium]PHR33621.1 MAG: uroporphyrinogen decarboxylase [Fluviicola sp.]